MEDATAGPEAVAGRRTAMSLMSIAMVLTMSTWFSASAVIPQLRDVWSLSTSERSLLTIAVQIGFVVGALGSATLNIADIFPARRVLAASAFGAAAANALLVIAGGAWAALVLRFLTGLFLAGVYPVILKLVATWYRTGRGAALGLMVGALTVGSAAPHLVNSLGGLDWEAVILATSALTAAGALLAVLFVREGPYPFPKAIFAPRQAGQVMRNRGIRLASFGYFGHMWELYAMWAWFLAFYTDALIADGGDASRAAAAAGTFAVIGIGGAGCWAGGVLGDSWGRTHLTSASMALSGACSIGAGLLFGGPAWLVLALGLVWGFAVVADSAQFSTIVSELADQAYVGTALTLQLAAGFTLTVVTIWLIPILRDHLGWEWAFAFLAPGPALGIAAMLYLQRLPEARLIAGGRG
ncbi:MAG: nitrate/nitrite transporter [Dehalococcoidia bacterium]